MSEAERRLEQPHDPRRALQVADVGLGRAHGQGVLGGAAGPEHRTERARLHAVPQRGAGAVQLHVLHVRAPHARAPVGQPQELFLGRPVGGRQPVPAAIVVDGAPVKHAVDVVPVGQRRGERPEHHHAAALPANVPAGAGVEGVAAPVRREAAEA